MLKGIDHIAIVVKDIDAALRVYRDALGLPPTHVKDVPAEEVKVAFLPLPDGSGEIELIQPTTERSGVARYLAKRGEGMHHICFEVDDILGAMAEMRANGLQVLEEEPRAGDEGQKYVFIHPKTAHGVLIELYQRPSSSDSDGQVGFPVTAEDRRRVEELEERLEWLQAQNLAYARDLASLFQRERAELQQLQKTETHLTHSDRLILIGQLAASVAHDLSNLITPILGYAQLILRQRDQITGDMVDIAERIFRSSQRANLLLRQLVDLSAERTQSLEVVNLQDLINETCDILGVRFRHSGIRVSKHFAGGAFHVLSNRVQLSQVFVNLFINAIDAMPDGGELKITTYASESEPMICIKVSDTGVGISSQSLPHIFEAFFTTKPEGEGTGLGLSVSREIVTQYGGRIEVASELGQGTTFSVFLPTEQAELAVE